MTVKNDCNFRHQYITHYSFMANRLAKAEEKSLPV